MSGHCRPILPVDETHSVTFRTENGGINLRAELFAIESRLIDAALRATSGNKLRASKLLGLERTSLVEKLRKRGLIQPKKPPTCATCLACAAKVEAPHGS